MADPTLEALAALISSPSQVDPTLGMATQPNDVDYSRLAPMQPQASDADLIDPSSVSVDWSQIAPPPAQEGPDPTDSELFANVPPPPSSTSAATSIGASKSGYSSTANKRVAGGPVARMEQKNARERAEIEARYRPYQEADAQVAGYEQQAIDAQAKAETDKIMELARGKNELAALNQEFKTKEEAAWADSRIGAEVAKAEYRAAVMDFASTNIDPNRLWYNADTVDRFGMGISAWIHNFLGAKGIKTTAMDTINQAIDRDINAQVANLNKKGQVSQEFKTLWDMQRAQSNSDAEARARLRGFALEQKKAALDSQLGQYDSRLVAAKGMAAKALIQKELVKNSLEVEKHIESTANAAANRAATVLGSELSASMQAMQIRSSERIHAADRESRERLAKGAGPTLADLYADTIADVSESGDTVVTRKFRPGTPPATQAEMVKKVALMSSIVDGMRTVKKLQATAGSRPDVLGETRFVNEKTRTARAMERYLSLALAYARSGKAINETEIKFTQDFFADDTWLTKGDNVKKLNQIMGKLIAETNYEVSGMSYELPKTDPSYGLKYGRSEFMRGEAAEAEVGEAEAQKTRVDAAVGNLSTKDALEAASPERRAGGVSGTTSASQSWQDYQASKAIPDDPSNPVTSTLTGETPGEQIGREKTAAYNAQPTNAFVAMDTLRQEAEAKKEDGTPAPEAKRAADLLRSWALLSSGDAPAMVAPDGSDPNSPASRLKEDYALYQYKLLKEHLTSATK